jgi:hypothetical protein
MSPQTRAGVRPVRLKLSCRLAEDRLLRWQFAIIIAPGNLRPRHGQIHVPVLGPLLLEANGLYQARNLTIVKEEVDDESWCGLPADRAWG